MINDIKKEAKQKMEKAIASFQSQLSRVRTGRAQPALLTESWLIITVPPPR